MRRALLTGLVLLTLALIGCRGTRSDNPPIHPNLDMDFQQKFGPQEANPFFEDNAAMRKPVPGTVARGELRDSSVLYRGRTPEGDYVNEIPVTVNKKLLDRGQDRYNIYCTPCHGKTGAGNGIIMRRDYGYTPASSYHVDRLRQAPDGYLYDVIANGVRNMPPYGQQIPVLDRWAIVAYIRALQRSQHAAPGDLPESVRSRLTSRENSDSPGQSGTE